MSAGSDDVTIGDGIVIPGEELRYRASRAGGPGGQHVNTTDSRVELRWSVRDSRALGEAQKTLLAARLGRRINQEGELVLHCATERSQHRNRVLVTARLASLVRAALVRRRDRVPTAPGRAAGERRLAAKRSRAGHKRTRERPDDEDD